MGAHPGCKEITVKTSIADKARSLLLSRQQHPELSVTLCQSLVTLGTPYRQVPPLCPIQPRCHKQIPAPYPDDTGDLAKYTKRHIERAQRPIPSVDLGEDEEALDPEVRTPDDVDFIKPPPLEELIRPR